MARSGFPVGPPAKSAPFHDVAFSSLFAYLKQCNITLLVREAVPPDNLHASSVTPVLLNTGDKALSEQPLSPSSLPRVLLQGRPPKARSGVVRHWLDSSLFQCLQHATDTAQRPSSLVADIPLCDREDMQSAS
jgi:hypothetical protein